MQVPARLRATLVLAVAASAALAVGGAALANPGDAVVTVKNFDFQPMAVTVPVGGAVTWKNLDEEPHAVTSVTGDFRSGALDEGDSFTFRLTKPGVYRYLCSIHPRMTASVTVK